MLCYNTLSGPSSVRTCPYDPFTLWPSLPANAKFWQQVWKQQHPRRIITFQWVLIQRSLPIGAWKRGILALLIM